MLFKINKISKIFKIFQEFINFNVQNDSNFSQFYKFMIWTPNSIPRFEIFLIVSNRCCVKKFESI